MLRKKSRRREGQPPHKAGRISADFRPGETLFGILARNQAFFRSLGSPGRRFFLTFINAKCPVA